MMMCHFDLPIRNRKDLARAAQLRNLALARPIPPSSPYGNNTYVPSSRRATSRPTRNNNNKNNPSNPYHLTTLIDPYLTPTDLHLLPHPTTAAA